MYKFPQKPVSAYSSNCSHNFMVKCVDPRLAWGKRLASRTAALEQVRWPSQLDWFLSLSSKICFQSLASRRRVCSQNVFHIVASVWFHWHGRRLQNIYRTLFITPEQAEALWEYSPKQQQISHREAPVTLNRLSLSLDWSLTVQWGSRTERRVTSITPSITSYSSVYVFLTALLRDRAYGNNLLILGSDCSFEILNFS